jgi:hypothetical protein
VGKKKERGKEVKKTREREREGEDKKGASKGLHFRLNDA